MTDGMEIDCQSVKQKLDNGEAFRFIDCREADEHATASIPQSTLLPMSEIADRVGELEPYHDEEIVVHCHHGGRSMRVAMWLKQQGFQNVKSMAGGIDVWAQTIDTSIPRY